MKYLFYSLMAFAVGLVIYGSIYKDELFCFNIYDMYFLISYKHLGTFLGGIVIIIALLIILIKRINFYIIKQ